MKLTTTPSLAKHLAKMMKGVLCPAAGKGNTTTCTPMGGAITPIANFFLHNHNQENGGGGFLDSSTRESDMDTLRPMTLLNLKGRFILGAGLRAGPNSHNLGQ